MCRFTYSAFILFITFCYWSVQGQNRYVTADLRAIQELTVSKEINKKWEIALGAKTIIQKDLSQAGEYDAIGSLLFKPVKYLCGGIGYQWSENRTRKGEFRIKHRWLAQLAFETKIERFKINYRVQYQTTDDELWMNDTLLSPQQILRNRIQLHYNIKNSQVTPFTFIEHYGQINRPGAYGLKLKWALGIDYRIHKSTNIKLYYRIDRQLNVDFPYWYYNLGVGFSYRF